MTRLDGVTPRVRQKNGRYVLAKRYSHLMILIARKELNTNYQIMKSSSDSYKKLREQNKKQIEEQDKERDRQGKSSTYSSLKSPFDYPEGSQSQAMQGEDGEKKAANYALMNSSSDNYKDLRAMNKKRVAEEQKRREDSKERGEATNKGKGR